MTAPDSTMQALSPRLKSVAQWIWAMTLLVSLVLVHINAGRYLRTRASKSWPTTSGIVTVSNLHYAPLSRTVTKYQLQFTYGYEVNGVPYQSERISFSAKTRFIGRTGGERFVKKVLAAYPEGKRVTVHYKPSDPGVAVLETGLPGRVIKTMMLGLATGVLSLAGLWRRWSLQTDHLFKPYDPEKPMTAGRFILGALGLASCLGIVWLWWELIKLYAGR